MELSKLKEELLRSFGIETLAQFKEIVKTSVLKNDFAFHSNFMEIINEDLKKDYLQIIFQYYFADRSEKKQDYTPPSLAKLCAELTFVEEETICSDICSGSGALTIQKWNTNKELKFICKEFDENVIPFLLFNLSIRNIEAVIFHMNVLSDEIYKIYISKKQDKFSFIEEVDKDLFLSTNEIVAESSISNPPYNIKWEIPFFAGVQDRFKSFTIPPSSNANFAFILSALSETSKKAALILPGCVLTSSGTEAMIREELINKNLIEAIIACPDNMFEATSIPVCIMLLNKKKNNTQITMINAKNQFSIEEREQKGQFGGNSKTNRTYIKKINVFSSENIKSFLDAISGVYETDFAKKITLEEVKKQNFILSPSRYLETKIDNEYRKLKDIVSDLNRVTAQKNTCKLTINETLARNLKFDNFLYKTKLDNTQLNTLLKNEIDEEIIEDNFISLTKNKNEIKFENNNKYELSEVLLLIMATWRSHIYHLNNEQNRYLAELRDTLISKLMNGDISVEI